MISQLLAQASAAMSAPAPAPQAPAPQPSPAQQLQQQQNPNQQHNGQQPVPAPANPAAQATSPAFQQAPASEPQNQSGLEQYNDLFNTTPADPNAPANGIHDAYIQFDEQQVREAISKRNFVPNDPQTQELVQKALGGDTAAFAEVLNTVAQGLYFSSAQAMARVSERAAQEGVRRLNDTLPNVMRNYQTQSTLAESAPNLNNPGVQPVVDQVRQNFQRMNPTASPAAIADMTKKYFSDITAAMNPQAQPQQSANKNGVTQDFSNFF